MKIAVLSDTHLFKGSKLPQEVWGNIIEADMILHAGDILNEDLLHDLELIAPVYAVLGNCDWNLPGLPAKRIILCGKYKIGLTHGYLGRGKDTPERAYNTFADEQVDIIVFGHSHIPYHGVRDGIILFNPGSPTQKRGQAQYSMGILRILDQGIIAEHIFFERS